MSTTTVEDQLAEVRLRVERLQGRLDAAGRSLGAHASVDWATFAADVEADLHACDTSLERLQADVAEAAWKAREEAEAAIAEVRSRRIELGERLAELAASQDRKDRR